jgi:hypothetical protein
MTTTYEPPPLTAVELRKAWSKAEAECSNLHAINADLLKALKPFAGLATEEELQHWKDHHFGSAQMLIHAEDVLHAQIIIAKAEGKS